MSVFFTGVSKGATEFGGATPLQWSLRFADSEMARSGGKLTYDARSGKDAQGKWDYAAGMFTLSLIKLGDVTGRPDFVEFAGKTTGSMIDDKGDIAGYKPDDDNLDNINSGKTLLALYSHTGEDRYRLAAARLRAQLDHQPRTSEGGFWHKKRYENQMWLDGLYMGSPFYAEYGLRFNNLAAFDDVAKQIRLADAHTYDAKTGLYYHGWDESKKQDWANKSTGTSPNFWSRAIGWYAMAIVDNLDFFPLGHPARPELLATLEKVAAGIAKYQDPKTGLWYQVTDQGARAGNYFEATASSMFVYALAKGVNHGYLPKNYADVARKGYEGIIRDLVKPAAQGRYDLTQCCKVAGLGYGRDGSYDYYVKEPIISNDLKGVGPLIFAGIEVEKLLNDPAGWDRVAKILEHIHDPHFPANDFSILNYGAPTDGKSDATGAIRKAIEACNAAGGGRVVVPRGTYATGAITLKSNVNLHVEEGATLLFSTDPASYMPNVLTRWEGVECYNFSALIYAYGEKNIAVTGKGTLDGQADYANWWGWVKKGPNEKGSVALARTSRDHLNTQSESGVPVAERVYGLGHYLRPNFIQTYRCRDVLIEGVTILRSPMWEVHPVLCNNVTVRGLEIVSRGPNNDGCDPESCRDVLIDKCNFTTGDDCIAIKSGRNNDGRRLLMPSENLIVRQSVMKDGHGGVSIGSEISGDCRYVFVEDCKMDSPDLDRALRLKTNAVRGGTMENIYMRNVEVGRVADAVVTIDFRYEEAEKGSFLPMVRNIFIENVTSRSSPRALLFVGFEKAPIRNVQLRNCTFSGVEGPDLVKYVENLEKIDVKVVQK